MDLKHLEQIKRLVIIAMFSDDDLMNMLVLKGGNALDIVYNVAPRASIDLDFSISSQFDQLDIMSGKIKDALTKVFDEHGYVVFDFDVIEKPQIPNDNTPEFWGGYQIEFKIIERQLPDYSDTIGREYRTARARDFFDIYVVLENFNIDLLTAENIALLKLAFEAKQVPLPYLSKIKEYREYHRTDFLAVQDTVKPNFKLKDFDFYFDYVVDICQLLTKALEVV